MKKEKLTPKIISNEIIENFNTLKLSWNGMTGIEFNILTFLEQIRNEIKGKDPYFVYKRMDYIDSIFDKYINEKGGK